MPLVLNEEQQLLKESADGFFAEKSPVSQLRDLRDRRDETGYDAGLWSEMQDMGFVSLLLTEDQGGAGFGYIGAGLVAQAMGRHLTASPFLAHSVAAASVLQSVGAADDLATLAHGEAIYTLAVDEGPRFAPEKTAMKARAAGDNYVLAGLKTFVPDGHVADRIVVLARTDGKVGDAEGLGLFVVERGAKGLITDRTVMADSRNWAKLSFENVPARLIGEAGGVYDSFIAAIDRINTVVASELLGIADQAFAMTTDYLKERQQFGRAIGSFQALQHRASHLFTEIEVTRSALLKALQAADGDAPMPWLSSLAKARAIKVADLATNEAVQMHGGIGMTDEYDIGFYMKRARPLSHLYGDYNYHADRFARTSGY